MKKIIVCLCLGLIGCATAAKETKTPPPVVRETAVDDQAEMDGVIAVFSEAIKKNPDNAGSYYNRAIAYFYKKDYQRCWLDVKKAESLGATFSDDFIASLKKASNQ